MSVLKLVKGNDITFKIRISYYDKDKKQYVSYDMSAAKNIKTRLICFSGNVINCSSNVDNNIVVAQIDDKDTEYTTYDVEVLWEEKGIDKRASMKNAIEFVDNSSDATLNGTTEVESNLNIEVNNDVATVYLGLNDVSYYYNDTKQLINIIKDEVNTLNDKLTASIQTAKDASDLNSKRIDNLFNIDKYTLQLNNANNITLA